MTCKNSQVTSMLLKRYLVRSRRNIKIWKARQLKPQFEQQQE